MEYQLHYSQLSSEGRHAWETVSGLPLATREQQCHAWDVLRSELADLSDDPQFGLHVVPNAASAVSYELFVSGPELSALRVMIAWLKAHDRSGQMRDLPLYPDLGEAIIEQLGAMPWTGVWQPSYLSSIERGGVLVLQPQSQALVLAQLLDFTLQRGASLCPCWPIAERVYLLSLLADVACWLQSMLVAHDHETA